MKTLFIRNLDSMTALRFSTNAGARGWTHPQYMTALIHLHTACKEKVEESSEIEEILSDLGLQAVVN